MHMDVFEKEYSKVCGKKVVGLVHDKEMGETFWGLKFHDGTIAWIERDPEGNGPGFLRVQPPRKVEK